MPYSNQSDMLERIEETSLIQLTDRDSSGQVDAALVSTAIEDADALINGLISPVYEVPLAAVPRVVREISSTIAIYRLHLYRSAASPLWKDAYKEALAFLDQVAERKAKLEGVAPKPAVAGSQKESVSFSAQPRQFSRTNLSEW